MRWLSLYSVALVGGLLLAVWEFGGEAVARVVFLVAVLGVLAGLFFKEHHWGARLSIWTFVATALTSSAFAWIWGWLSASWWLKILFSLAVTPVMYLANAGFRADVRRGQRRRDAVANTVAERVVAGEPSGDPFALYLRPFVTTERLPAQSLPSSPGMMEIPVHLDLETVFERALRGRCPIVALGSTGDIAEGAARITATNRRWRTVVAALADQSAFVVMVPLARPGTSWELQWLTKHHLLDKILMVMPETVGSVPSGVIRTTEQSDRIFKVGIQTWDPAEHEIDLAARWRQAAKAARNIGIELPPLATVGALFKIDVDTRQVGKIMPLPLSTATRRAGYLRDAVTSMGLFKFNQNPPPDIFLPSHELFSIVVGPWNLR